MRKTLSNTSIFPIAGTTSLGFSVGIICERHTSYGHHFVAITAALFAMLIAFHLTRWWLGYKEQQRVFEQKKRAMEWEANLWLDSIDNGVDKISPQIVTRHTPFFAHFHTTEELLEPKDQYLTPSTIWNRPKPTRNRYKR